MHEYRHTKKCNASAILRWIFTSTMLRRAVLCVICMCVFKRTSSNSKTGRSLDLMHRSNKAENNGAHFFKESSKSSCEPKRKYVEWCKTHVTKMYAPQFFFTHAVEMHLQSTYTISQDVVAQTHLCKQNTYLNNKGNEEKSEKWKVRRFFPCWAADSICYKNTVPRVFHIVNTNAPTSSSSSSLHRSLALQNSPEVQRIFRGD